MPIFAVLLPTLHRLDRLLEWAMRALPPEREPDASAPFRGLFLSRQDVARSLAREPGATPFGTKGKLAEDDLGELAPADSPLAWLIHAFGLCNFDVDLLLLALAPEIDLRYEKIFGYLQDDVTRRRPTVELALNLLCASADEKLEQRRHFSPNGQLIRHGLLHIVPDPNQVEPPHLAHYLKLDDQITRLLLGQGGLDGRLAPFCQIVEPGGSIDDLPLSPVLRTGLSSMLRRAWCRDEALRIYVRDPEVLARHDVARALVAQVPARLLALDMARFVAAGEDFPRVISAFLREVRFRGAIPYLDGIDLLQAAEHTLRLESLKVALAERAGITILGGAHRWVSSARGPTGVIEVHLDSLDSEARRAHWQASLESLGVSADNRDLQAVAGRFRLSPTQIADASHTARNFALLRAAGEASNENDHPAPALAELFAAARAQSGHGLAALARKIEPKYTWKDIVLPENTVAQLREICSRVVHQHRVLCEWGFDRKLSHGKGVNALFAGPSGCGKTMAAEIIANELQLDLYKIDLAGVVSKYIGETEKNLDRIFKAAEDSNAILFFDEADALFGKRSEVRDSHDRYANIEVSYLLQKMEEYEGMGAYIIWQVIALARLGSFIVAQPLSRESLA